VAQPALIDANRRRIAGQPMNTQNRAQACNPLNPIDARFGRGRRFERFWSREDRVVERLGSDVLPRGVISKRLSDMVDA
jgi:hypothetical protein